MTHVKIISNSREQTLQTTSADVVTVGFPIFSWADLTVTVNGSVTDSWSGVEKIKGILENGTIRFNEPVSGTVVLRSDVARERTTDFVEGAGLPISAMNTEFDRIWAAFQEDKRGWLELRDLISDLSARVDANYAFLMTEVQKAKAASISLQLKEPKFSTEAAPEVVEIELQSTFLTVAKDLGRVLPVLMDVSPDVKPMMLHVIGACPAKYSWQVDQIEVVPAQPSPEIMEYAA